MFTQLHLPLEILLDRYTHKIHFKATIHLDYVMIQNRVVSLACVCHPPSPWLKVNMIRAPT
jgi:hypothetical protein